MAKITCGNCHETHDTVEDVRACYRSVADTRTPSAYVPSVPATERQMSFIATLREERDMTAEQAAVDVSTLDKIGASRHIESLLTRATLPKGSRPSAVKTMADVVSRVTPQVTEGMYKMDGTIYKVQVAVHGSGHLYAKRLIGQSFAYAPGAMRLLRPEHRMTLEQAREWGMLYGSCCVCGRTLTDETSIANGIGPVCAGKGWWTVEDAIAAEARMTS